MVDRDGQRLDKWLWFARIVKTRTLAGQLVTSGKVRVNRVKVSRPSRLIYPEDVVTAVAHGRPRVIRVLALAARRGPASEARALYEDLSPPAPRPPRESMTANATAFRDKGSGRPTKRDRRLIDAWTASARRGES